MWELFQSGGPLMWPLLLCSIVSFTVILERAWFWMRIDLEREGEATDRLLKAVEEGRIPKTDGKKTGLIHKMMAAGMCCGRESCAKAMEVVALSAIGRMRKGMPVLDTIITLAPMLGIMGTVTGIIESFDMLGQASTSDPKDVVGGIAEALITTATGLGISVVTVFPYNYFNSRIDQAQDMMETYASRLEILRCESTAKNAE